MRELVIEKNFMFFILQEIVNKFFCFCKNINSFHSETIVIVIRNGRLSKHLQT